MAFIGIDLGTTTLKAAVLDETGRLLARMARPCRTHRPAPGQAEQDPQDWLLAIRAALHEFGAQGLAGRIGWGCLSSQVNTHVFVDRAGASLMPAILWQDTRAAAEAAELDARLTADQKRAWLGAEIPVDASHPLARMLWVARHRPEVWAATAHVLLPKDFALLHLTGVLCADPLSNFGVVGPDLAYAGPVLDLVPGAAARMAPLAGLTEGIGRLKPDLGLGPEVRMVAGTMDGWTGIYGAGAARPGQAVWLGGTSEILGRAGADSPPGIVGFPAVDGLRLLAGPTQAGGASLSWLAGLFGLPVATLAAEAAARPPRPGSTLFLPHLAGERAPLWDPQLRGAFLGLEAGMERADLVRAVIEGAALSARLVLETLGGGEGALACGGGSFAEGGVAQMRADLIGRPLRRLAVNEPVILGAVALAACGAGAFAGLPEAAAALIRTETEWEPDPRAAARSDALFGLYKEAIAATSGLSHRLALV